MSQEALSSIKGQLLRDFGERNHLQAARPLTDAEADLVFERGELGKRDPEVLHGNVWWLSLLQFGFLARNESRQSKCANVIVYLSTFFFFYTYFFAKMSRDPRYSGSSFI